MGLAFNPDFSSGNRGSSVNNNWRLLFTGTLHLIFMYYPKQERTFMMIKPDGVRKGLIGEIIKRIEQRDLKIVIISMSHADLKQIDGHYPKDKKWISRLGDKTLATYKKYNINPMEDLGTDDNFEVGKMIRGWLVDYMTSAPVVKMVIQGLHAVDMVRKIAGPTLPYLADMGTIRGDFSNDSPALANSEKRAVMNLVHASETPEEAKHEIKYWFGEDAEIFDYKRFGVDE